MTQTGKIILYIVAGAAALGLLLCAGCGIFLWYISQNPEGVDVAIESPANALRDQPFTLTVVVRNHRTGKPFQLTDIDISDEFMKSFFVVSVNPKEKSNMYVPLDEKRSYTFDRPVPPGETARFTFQLRPIATGVKRGDIDVCEGVRFLTAQAEILVTESDPPEKR